MSLKFVKSSSSASGEQALLNTLCANLKDKIVLWIVSGGSNIPISVRVMRQIPEKLSKNLLILLSDERYGTAGHQFSNFSQLEQAGFDPKQAKFQSILVGENSPTEALERYMDIYQQARSRAGLIIAQLGIGDDGHIAGILPESPEIESADTAVYYQSDLYQRLSLSLQSISLADEVFVFCFGQNKATALKNLEQDDLDVFQMPSKILSLVKEVYIYNDQLGDNT